MLGPAALGTPIDLTGCTLAALYLRGTGVVSGGSLQIEEASDPNYAGTWAPIGAAITASTLNGDKELVTHLAVGAYAFVRVRAATPVSGGGTVTVTAVAVSAR